MIVIQQGYALRPQGFAGFVQPLRQLPHTAFIAVIKAVHAGDDHRVRPKFPGFPHDLIAFPLQASQICVQADHGKSGLAKQRFPVQLAALAGGHARCPGHEPHHHGGRMDHEAIELNAFVTGDLYPVQGGAGCCFAARHRPQHDLLYCFSHFLIPCRMRFSCLMLCSSAPPCFSRLSMVMRPSIRWSAGLSFTASATSPRSDAPLAII